MRTPGRGRRVDPQDEGCPPPSSRYPDHDARYGDRERAYCVHDSAYLIAWLVEALELAEAASFQTNVEWLRRILDARGFP